MRELSVQEIEYVNGGFVFTIPPAVKVVVWATTTVATAAAGYYGERWGASLSGSGR